MEHQMERSLGSVSRLAPQMEHQMERSLGSVSKLASQMEHQMDMGLESETEKMMEHQIGHQMEKCLEYAMTTASQTEHLTAWSFAYLTEHWLAQGSVLEIMLEPKRLKGAHSMTDGYLGHSMDQWT
eukprot:1336964-Ditylum_brightwellii.AAC.1